MTPDSLKDLYVEQLRDLHSAEDQLISALPKMAKKASNTELQRAFEQHLEETRRHKERIEQIFKRMDMSPKGRTCEGMKGLIKEAKHAIKETKSLLGKDAPSEVRDAMLIAQAQRAEHYEIAGYGTVATYAEELGLMEDRDLLAQTLGEEKETDAILTRLAEQRVNLEAERT